jgi:rod shape-determining protein MreC
MPKRPHYLALSLVVLIVVLILSLPSRRATQVKLAFGSLFLPLFGLASTVHTLADQTELSLQPRRALERELVKVRRENHELKLREMQMSEVWRENERLRQAFAWQKQNPWKPLLARVILRDPANWWRSVQIDKGRRDGVKVNLPVLSTEGLVGRVTQVGYSTSQVTLVGDPACGVSAVVQDAGVRDYGVINSGTSSVLDSSIVGLTFIDRQAAIKPGQRVLTSGLGEVFPPGILIGHVLDTNSVGFGLYTEARVKLASNLDNLEEVFVIIP